jgi:GNAT superfamily N-acetyltransferase
VSPVLRTARPADATRIANILLESRKVFLTYAPSPHTDDETRAWVRDLLVPSGQVTVAVLDGTVTGVLAIERADGMSWINQLYVHPSHVANGIGSTLLSWALETSPRPIRLFTFQQNSGARRFYERNGFTAIRFSDGSTNEERCPDILYELI